MRASTFAIALLLIVPTLPAIAADLAVHEAACIDIGFKKKTPAYGDCVLELDRRAKQGAGPADSNQSRTATNRVAARVSGDGSPDDQTCQRYGYQPGDQGYSQCRLSIDIARQQAQQRQAQYDLEKRRYEEEQRQYQEKLAAYEKEKERQRKDAAVRMGLALMGGTSPHASENINNAARQSLGMPPVAPSRPQIQNFMITGPSGRTTNCTVAGQLINCN